MYFFFFFKQKTAYEIGVRLVGSEMCIRDRYNSSILLLIIQHVFNGIYVFSPDPRIFLDILFSIYGFWYILNESKAAETSFYLIIYDKLAVFSGNKEECFASILCCLGFFEDSTYSTNIAFIVNGACKSNAVIKFGIIVNCRHCYKSHESTSTGPINTRNLIFSVNAEDNIAI